MKNFDLTTLEKAVLKDGLSEGYIYDGGAYDPNRERNFLCWGFYGKQERGAAASLVKKGILYVDHYDGDTYVYLCIPLEQAEKLAGYKA